MSCTVHGLQTVPPILTVLICVTTCSTLLDSFIQEDLCVCVANFKLVHSCFVFSAFFRSHMDVDQKHRPTTRRSRSSFWYYTILFWGSVVWIHCHDHEIHLIIPSFASFPSFNPPFRWPKPPLLMVNRGIEDFMNNFEQGVQAVKHEAGSGFRTPSRKLKA